MSNRSKPIACCLALFLSMPALAAERRQEWQQFITERWYRMEVVIFERPNDGSQYQPEAVLTDGDRSSRRTYPAVMHAVRLRPEEARRRYPIRGDGCNTGGPGSQGSTFGDRPRASSRRQHTPADQRTSSTQPPRQPPELSSDLALLRDQVADIEQTYFDTSYRWLAPATWQLRSQAAALERRGNMRILFHGTWQQPVPERSAPSPILFQEGPIVGKHQQLEGSLGVTVGRYLHFHAQLWLHSASQQAPTIGPVMGLDTASGANRAPPAFKADYGTGDGHTYVQLNESRRMRSGELNYLDHPNFGILVKIEPLDVGESLARLSPTG